MKLTLDLERHSFELVSSQAISEGALIVGFSPDDEAQQLIFLGAELVVEQIHNDGVQFIDFVVTNQIDGQRGTFQTSYKSFLIIRNDRCRD